MGRSRSKSDESNRSSAAPPDPNNEQLATVDESRPFGDSAARRKGKEDQSMLDHLFGNTRPKNVGSGLLGGVGSIAKGVVFGAGALVAAPVVGYKEGGATGMLKGVGLGVTAAVALPVAGVIAGAKQTVQGTKTTVESFQSKNAGKVFDEKTGQWVDKFHRLDEAFAQAQSEKLVAEAERRRLRNQLQSGSKRRKATGDGSVVDTEYYDLLGVSPMATASEIRKAYYQLAKECHPDKHGGDPAMKEKFQQIGEAYQVLGDPERRELYNQQGKAAADQMEFMDSSLLFVMLFGSDAMQPYIGKLKLATTVEAEPLELDGAEEISEQARDYLTAVADYMDASQHFREVELAVLLRDRLQPYVEAKQKSDSEALAHWKKDQYNIAKKLCEESFGAELLDAVGFGYENCASRYLDSKDAWYGATRAKFTSQKRQFDLLFGAASAASKATRVAKKEQKKREKMAKKMQSQETQPLQSDSSPDDDSAGMEQGLEHILKTILNICLYDIATTIKSACKKTVNDKAVEESEQRIRAEGLLQLGKLFQDVAGNYQARNKPVDAMSQMQEAYIKMAQKMDEQHHGGSNPA